MKNKYTTFPALLLALLGTAPAASAITFDFESGVSEGATSFSGEGTDFVLTGDLVITRFDTFGSGGGDWFIDTGFGQSRSGLLGGFATVSATEGFQINSMDLWTSTDGGNSFASGSVTFSAVTGEGATVTQTITVTPTGNSGAQWDVSNDLSNFAGLSLKSFSFAIDAGADYLAIDKINLTIVPITPIPEPSSAVLGAGLITLAFVTTGRRRRA